MSHTSREALFYALLFLFLVLGTGIVFFAQGWRMDFPSFKISKIGGIYVHSFPDDAAIFLNGKPVQNQSGFLNRGTLISDLFPKIYRLTLTAPGFDDWNENVAVAPALVANHKYAVLVPASAANVTTSEITSFKASQDSMVIETSLKEITSNGKMIGFGKLIAASPDLQSAVFQTAKGTYEFADMPADTVTDLSNILSKEKLGGINSDLFFSPLTNTTLLAANSGKIDLLDLTQATDTEIAAAPKGMTIALKAIAVSPSTIAWAYSASRSNSSSLLFYDISRQSIIASTTIALGSPVAKLSWANGGTLGILTDNGSLYLYDMNQERAEKIADDVRSFSITADGSRIATIESRSFEIFTPGDPEEYYRFNIPNVSDVQAALWYRDSDHLFIVYPDHVAFLDLQDSSLANFTTIAFGTSPQYDPATNDLYLIDEHDSLLRFNFSK